MRYSLLLPVCLLGLLVAGCAGTPRDDMASSEPAYVSDSMLEAFHGDLQSLSIAIELADAAAERSLRATLADTSRMYQRALLSALYDDSSTPRRRVAAVMLGFTGDAAIVPALLDTVNNGHEVDSVRTNALLGLAVMGDRLRDFSDHDALMRGITNAMQDPDSPPAMRRAAITTFAVAYERGAGESIMPLRALYLSDPDSQVKIVAVNAMGDIGDPAAVEDLRTAAEGHPDTHVQIAATIALGKIEDPNRAIPALETAARDDHPRVRRHAIDALARHFRSDPDRVYTAVLLGLADFDERVRESAAIALARIGDDRAISPLLQATGDRTAIVREAAAAALGNLITQEREKEAYPLVELLADQSHTVQAAAITSLSRVTGTDHGSDQTRWRRYFYTKYPDLNPANLYDGKPKPRFSTGISTGQRRATTSPRTQQRPQQRNTNARNQRQPQQRNLPQRRR